MPRWFFCDGVLEFHAWELGQQNHGKLPRLVCFVLFCSSSYVLILIFAQRGFVHNTWRTCISQEDLWVLETSLEQREETRTPTDLTIPSKPVSITTVQHTIKHIPTDYLPTTAYLQLSTNVRVHYTHAIQSQNEISNNRPRFLRTESQAQESDDGDENKPCRHLVFSTCLEDVCKGAAETTGWTS